MTFVKICIALFVCSQALYFTPLIHEVFDCMVRSAEQWPTSTQCFTWYMWSSAARWGVQQRAVTSMVQWPTWCIDHLTTLHVVFNYKYKVRVQHSAVTSTLYMWSLTARWECSMVQWPAHFTYGLWLQGENAAWCSDQHTLHYMVFNCKVRVQ